MDDQQRAREQFEAWANAEGYCVSRLIGHNYLDVAVHAAWDAWQAALRAAPECPEGFVMVRIKDVEALICSVTHSPRSALAASEVRRAIAARPQGVKE